jgi:hypothetical protein
MEEEATQPGNKPRTSSLLMNMAGMRLTINTY